MGGGPKDIDKTPDKPFSPSDSHKVTQAKPAQTTPEGMTPDESTVLDLAPTWGRWSQIFYPADKTLDPAPVGTVAEVYRDIAGILKAGFTDMDNGMKTVLADQWSGAGADAAQQVTQAYVANGDALHAAVMGMNVNLVNLSDVVSVTKSNLPHPDDVKSYLETAVNDAIESANRQGHITVTTPDSQDPQFTLTGNVQYSRAGGHTSVTAAQIQPLFDEALRSVDEVAQNTMSSSFYPGLQASDRGVPAYAIATPNTSAPPSAPPGGPGSGGAGGGGSAPPSFSGGGGGGLGGGG
ncbi:hypothetical protein, partial [Williamsia sp.]|uniref:hypothetical protein n=1 Tax=Williamsia sp. TaxID=1872085 RepID=UPI001A2CA6A7